jgi:hypothetical protein
VAGKSGLFRARNGMYPGKQRRSGMWGANLMKMNGLAIAFSSEVDTGSREENASKLLRF